MAKLGQITRVEKQPATNTDYRKQHYARHCEQYFGWQFHTPIFARRLAPYFPIDVKVAELLTPVAKPSIRPDNSRARIPYRRLRRFDINQDLSSED